MLAPSTVTPAGPRRDLLAERVTWSEHLADDFAADIGGARLGVGHDAARRRQDRDAEAVEVRGSSRIFE